MRTSRPAATPASGISPTSRADGRERGSRVTTSRPACRSRPRILRSRSTRQPARLLLRTWQRNTEGTRVAPPLRPISDPFAKRLVERPGRSHRRRRHLARRTRWRHRSSGDGVRPARPRDAVDFLCEQIRRLGQSPNCGRGQRYDRAAVACVGQPQPTLRRLFSKRVAEDCSRDHEDGRRIHVRTRSGSRRGRCAVAGLERERRSTDRRADGGWHALLRQEWHRLASPRDRAWRFRCPLNPATRRSSHHQHRLDGARRLRVRAQPVDRQAGRPTISTPRARLPDWAELASPAAGSSSSTSAICATPLVDIVDLTTADLDKRRAPG